MTVKELKKIVSEIPDEYGILKVVFYDSYTGCACEFANRKPKLDKNWNHIVFSSPDSQYSPYDR